MYFLLMETVIVAVAAETEDVVVAVENVVVVEISLDSDGKNIQIKSYINQYVK